MSRVPFMCRFYSDVCETGFIRSTGVAHGNSPVGVRVINQSINQFNAEWAKDIVTSPIISKDQDRNPP